MNSIQDNTGVLGATTAVGIAGLSLEQQWLVASIGLIVLLVIFRLIYRKYKTSKN